MGIVMSKKLNSVWQVVDSRNFGGIESHILQLACGLKLMGINTHVIFLNDYGQHPMRAQLHDNRIDYYVCNQQSLLELLKKHKPTVIHSHGYKAGIISRFSALLSNIPVISTYHAGEKPTGKMAVYDFIDRYTGFLAKATFAVSDLIQQRLPFKSEVAKNFVQMPTFSQDNLTDNSVKQIAFVGRLSKEKGIKQLLAISKALPNITVDVYGDGPEKTYLSEHKSDNLKMHGQVTDMAGVWKNIKLLLLPSEYEGLPMVVLEAMSRGIPVIASDVGDLHKVVKHQNNGWLISKKITKSYVNAINQFTAMTDKQMLDLRDNAQRTIEERYSAKVILPELINCYKKVVL